MQMITEYYAHILSRRPLDINVYDLYAFLEFSLSYFVHLLSYCVYNVYIIYIYLLQVNLQMLCILQGKRPTRQFVMRESVTRPFVTRQFVISDAFY